MRVYWELIDQFQSDKSFVFPPAARLELSWQVFLPPGGALAANRPDRCQSWTIGFEINTGGRREKCIIRPRLKSHFTHFKRAYRLNVRTFFNGHWPYKAPNNGLLESAYGTPWLLNGSERDRLANPLKAPITHSKSNDWHLKTGPKKKSQTKSSASVCMTIFSILTFNNYCVTSIAWQCDKGCQERTPARPW